MSIKTESSEINSLQNESPRTSRVKAAGRAIFRLTSLGLLTGGTLIGLSGAKDSYDAIKIDTDKVAAVDEMETTNESLDKISEKQDLIKNSIRKAGLATSLTGIVWLGSELAGRTKRRDGIVPDGKEVGHYDGPPNSFIEKPPEEVIEKSIEVPLTPNLPNNPDDMFRRPQ